MKHNDPDLTLEKCLKLFPELMLTIQVTADDVGAKYDVLLENIEEDTIETQWLGLRDIDVGVGHAVAWLIEHIELTVQ